MTKLTRASAAKTLGVAVSADVNEVKKAYRTLALQYHPDKADPEQFTKQEAGEKGI